MHNKKPVILAAFMSLMFLLTACAGNGELAFPTGDEDSNYIGELNFSNPNPVVEAVPVEVTPVEATPVEVLPVEVEEEPALAPGTSYGPDGVSIVESDATYFIYVEKDSYTLTIFERTDDGAYTDVYAAYRISHGGNKTPAGTFSIGEKERWHEFPDGGFVQYATRYHERLYIHSPLYGSENPGHLWPMYYDDEHAIGGPNTGGCLRMVTEAALFIYDNCDENTLMQITNGAPLGTTSDEVPDRNGLRIDPTDVAAIEAYA